MAKANLTLQLDKDVIRRARILAARRGLWTSRTGALSTQVLGELYAVATRKFDPPLSRRAAREIVPLYGTWSLVEVDLPLILAASELEERHRPSFRDSLVVEAARRSGATRLVTGDSRTGARSAASASRTRSAESVLPWAVPASVSSRRCRDVGGAVRGWNGADG